jgi:hypothetical protein
VEELPSSICFIAFFLPFLVVLGMEARALNVPGTCCTLELHPGPLLGMSCWHLPEQAPSQRVDFPWSALCCSHRAGLEQATTEDLALLSLGRSCSFLAVARYRVNQ